ncbi:MAG: prolyl oligopeptidase family serine peptidase [Candidatus Marinimicrobia bacterium]|nr:prolyl oligopeptidase family serine peptidase [Candidatus Neomarinimicrobiota bacterium]
MKLKIQLIILATLSICFWSCEDKISDPERGNIISTTPIFTYQAGDIETYLAISGMDIQLGDIHGVEAVKIVYETIDLHNNRTTASGAFFLPLEVIDPPLLSLQHGTETKRSQVASVNPFNSVEGRLGLILSAMGYCTAVPDYLGLGESDLFHPYLHAKSTATSVIDFLRAIRNYCDKNDIGLNEQLFLTGYSEGGYATLAVHREIEKFHTDEFQLTAVAPMAGPYNLAGTVDTIFTSLAYTNSIYPAFILTAYNQIYGWDRLDDFFQPAYATILPGLFDGSKSYSEIGNQLPSLLTDLLNPIFVTDYLNGNETIVRATLEENTLLDWSPTVPLRFFHGDADEVVPYYNAVAVVQSLSANSSTTVELITIENGTHETAGEAAIIGMIEWFAGF